MSCYLFRSCFSLLQSFTSVEGGTASEAQRQVAYADKILLNKIDLVDSATLQAIQERLRTINAAAEVFLSFLLF